MACLIMAPTAVTLNDRLQAFSNAIHRPFMQHFTRFQLTACSRGPSALAELSHGTVNVIRLLLLTVSQSSLKVTFVSTSIFGVSRFTR